jgi:hypothetical protein
MKHIVVCILLGWAVTACAPSVPLAVVTPAPKSAREPKPAADVANEGAVTPRNGAGAIVLTRRKTWLGSRCTFDVALDDQHVAGLRPGEQLTLYADPGQRTIDVSIRDGDGCDPANAHLALDVVPHATKRIQLRSDAYYDLKVEVNSYGASLPP